MVRTNQGGSVLSFIIVGVVATLLLIGGVYIVRHQQSVQPQPTPSPVVTTKPQETKKPTSEKQNKDKTAPSEKPAEQPKEQTPAPSQPAPSTLPVNGKELPQTGPSEMVGTLIVLGLVSGTLFSYLRSRHPRFSL